MSTNDDLIGKICPFCQTPIKQGVAVTICSLCNTPHHSECWQENNGCTTFGCKGKHGHTRVVGRDDEAQTFNIKDNLCPLCRGTLVSITANEKFCPVCRTTVRFDERGRMHVKQVKPPESSTEREGIQIRSLIAGIIVIVILALIGTLLYKTHHSWERQNSAKILELKTAADQLVASGKVTDGYSKYEELMKFIGDHPLKNKKLRRALEDVKSAREKIYPLVVAEQENKKKQEEQKRVQDQSVQNVTSVVDGWLMVQKRGEWGTEYWQDPNEACTFFAVSKWEILSCVFADKYSGGYHALVKVRIESSTKGGLPISKIWSFYMIADINRPWRIEYIEEAQ
jgi:hypothetical protein